MESGIVEDRELNLERGNIQNEFYDEITRENSQTHNNQQVLHPKDQNIFIQKIRKIIDLEIENIITKIYEFHIHKQSNSYERELKDSEKNVIEFNN